MDHGGEAPPTRDAWREDRVRAALDDRNPTVLTRLPGAFAVVGDVQWLPGYCVLLTDRPGVERLSDLFAEEQRAYLGSLALLASVVEEVCAERDPGFRRVNLEILGNTDPFLHAHVWPRYAWEPPDLVGKPVWLYPDSHWSDPVHALGPQHDSLRAALTDRLGERSAAQAGEQSPGRLAR